MPVYPATPLVPARLHGVFTLLHQKNCENSIRLVTIFRSSYYRDYKRSVEMGKDLTPYQPDCRTTNNERWLELDHLLDVRRQSDVPTFKSSTHRDLYENYIQNSSHPIEEGLLPFLSKYAALLHFRRYLLAAYEDLRVSRMFHGSDCCGPLFQQFSWLRPVKLVSVLLDHLFQLGCDYSSSPALVCLRLLYLRLAFYSTTRPYETVFFGVFSMFDLCPADCARLGDLFIGGPRYLLRYVGFGLLYCDVDFDAANLALKESDAYCALMTYFWGRLHFLLHSFLLVFLLVLPLLTTLFVTLNAFLLTTSLLEPSLEPSLSSLFSFLFLNFPLLIHGVLKILVVHMASLIIIK